MKRLIFAFCLICPVGAYAGTAIPLTVALSEAVTVTGTPRIAVDVGGQTRYATYSSGSGTNSLTFTLSPQAGDVDLDGIAVSSPIDLNGGTIQDVGGNSLSSLAFTPPSTSGIKVNYPSLGMDFVYDSDGRYTLNGTAYNDLTSFLSAAGGTFTRASIGTYYDSAGLMHTASSNVPRFDWDPVTHTAKGLLIEQSRINYITKSADISAFAGANHTVSASSIVAPDGTFASQLTFSSGTAINTGKAYVAMPAVAGEVYTFSLWVGAVSGYAASTSVGIYSSVEGWGTNANSTAEIVQGPGSIGSQFGGLFAVTGLSTSALTKVRVTRTLTSASNISANIYPNTSSAQTSAANVYWGAQFEKGPSMTSYIPTNGASVTRAADTLSIPTGSWFSATGGALFSRVLIPSILNTPSSSNTFWSLSDGTVSNFTLGRVLTNSSAELAVKAGGVAQVNKSSTSLAAGATAKVATAYAVNDFSLSVNGNAVATSSSGTLPSVSTLQVGQIAAINYLNSTISQLKYYPVRVPNAQLVLMSQ